jgi:hypothetical protein
MFLKVKNEVCRGWKVPTTASEARVFASEVKRFAKKIDQSSDGIYKYEHWQTKGKKVFVLVYKEDGGCLKEIGWIHSQTKEYEPIWVNW